MKMLNCALSSVHIVRIHATQNILLNHDNKTTNDSKEEYLRKLFPSILFNSILLCLTTLFFFTPTPPKANTHLFPLNATRLHVFKIRPPAPKPPSQKKKKKKKKKNHIHQSA